MWFLDHNYVESMNDMFKKVNAREKLIGWYHTGPKLRASDLEINELFKRYTPNPLLVIIDVQPKEVGVPTDAYFAVEEIKDVSSPLLAHAFPFPSSDARTRQPAITHCAYAIYFRGRRTNSGFVIIGRHDDVQNLCAHALDNRSRRSRGNRRGAPAA